MSQSKAVVVHGTGQSSTICTNRRAIDLKQFEVVKVLGAGVYAKVVLVHDRTTDQHFAVKIIRNGRLPMYSATVKELMFEKEIMDKLSGRQWFAQCYFTALTLTHAWFCLRYYPGGTLADVLEKCVETKKKLDFRDAQYILAELVCAIGEMHSHGVLHRDIKENNVMIDEEGHVVLIDFGLSVVLDTTKPLRDQVYHEKFEDSYHYIAPEMTKVPVSYSYPADLYALGMLTWNLCNKETIDRSSCSSDRTRDAKDLIDALTEDEPRKRATITVVTNHQFFQGIRWEDVAARKLDMSKFRPTGTVTQKAADNELHSDLGDHTIRPDLEPRLRDFCSFQRYTQEFLKEQASTPLINTDTEEVDEILLVTNITLATTQD